MTAQFSSQLQYFNWQNDGWCCQQPHQQASLFTACCWQRLLSTTPLQFKNNISTLHQHGRRWWIHPWQQHPQRRVWIQKGFLEAMDMWPWFQHCHRMKCKARDIQWRCGHWCHQSQGLTITTLVSAWQEQQEGIVQGKGHTLAVMARR